MYIVFPITVTSPAYESTPAFPIIFTVFASSNFVITFWLSSGTVNDLHVIVPVPSYNSNINKTFSDFVIRFSRLDTLPSNVILVSLGVISFIFTLFSLAFVCFPSINS